MSDYQGASSFQNLRPPSLVIQGDSDDDFDITTHEAFIDFGGDRENDSIAINRQLNREAIAQNSTTSNLLIPSYPQTQEPASRWPRKSTMVPLASIWVRRPLLRASKPMAARVGGRCSDLGCNHRHLSFDAYHLAISIDACLLTCLLNHRNYLLLRCHVRGYQCRDHRQRAG